MCGCYNNVTTINSTSSVFQLRNQVLAFNPIETQYLLTGSDDIYFKLMSNRLLDWLDFLHDIYKDETSEVFVEKLVEML